MNKITKGEQSKQKIIECAAELFLKNGYNATGINDILARTGLPKGSFYFHFASKKELAIEASYYFEKQIGSWILRTSKGKVWDDFICDLTDDMIKGAQDNTYFGCPFTALGAEVAFADPDISEYYAKPLRKLVDIFASIFEFSGISKDKAPVLANRAFAMYEGYLLYYRISKDINTFTIMKNDLIDIYIKTL